MEQTISDSAEAPAGTGLWQRVRDAARQFGLRAFWHWWLGELAPLLPAGVRNAARRRRLRPVLAFGDDSAVLWVPRIANGKLGFEEAARIPLSPDPGATTNAGRAAISALPRVAYGGPVTEAKVVVALPESQVLRKTITLPAAVEDNLVQALAYDLDRHTPFKTDELYFDAAVVGRDSAKKEIRVELAAALRTTVDLARRRAESWGAVVVGVTPGPPPGGSLVDRTPAEPASVGRAPGGIGVSPPRNLGAAGADRVAGRRRRRAADLAETRLRHSADAACAAGAPAGRGVECAARSTGAAHRRLQLRAAEKVHVPQRRAGRRGRHEAPSRRHLAHAVRGEEHAQGEGAESRYPASRRERQRRTPHFPARGFEAVRAGGAALADDQDPARPGRDLRSGRPAQAAAAARRGARGRTGAGASVGGCPRRRRRDPHLRHRCRDRQRRRRRQDPHPRRPRRDPHPRRQHREPAPPAPGPAAGVAGSPAPANRIHAADARRRIVAADVGTHVVVTDAKTRARGAGARIAAAWSCACGADARSCAAAPRQGAAPASPAQWVAPAQPSPAAKGAT